jgi:hypothetical protein
LTYVRKNGIININIARKANLEKGYHHEKFPQCERQGSQIGVLDIGHPLYGCPF